MRPIILIALNDVKLLARDRAGLFWALAFPILMAVFFGVNFSSSRTPASMPVVVINESTSTLAQSYVSALQNSPSLFVKLYTAPDTTGSTRTLTLDDARDQVRRGKSTAYIRLTEDFGDLSAFFQTTSPLEVGYDPSRSAESGFLQGILIQSLFSTAGTALSDGTINLRDLALRSRQDLASSAGVPPDQKRVFDNYFGSLDSFLGQVDSRYLRIGGGSPATTATQTGAVGSVDLGAILTMKPVERDTTGKPRSGFEVTFPSGILWGVIGVVASFAMALVQERQQGTLVRLRVAPISESTILAGKALGCVLACLTSICVVLMIGVWGFGVRIGNPAHLTAAIGATCICFVGIMMLITTISRSEKAVAGAGWAILLIMMMFGGGMIPLIAMPPWMQTASYFSPTRWAILAMEGAIWRDFSPQEMLQPLGILCAVGAVGFALGVRRFRQ